MNVVFPGYDYTTALTIAGVDTLRSRRDELTRRFFTRHVLNETLCIHQLLPPKRDENIMAKLRKTRFLKTVKQIPTNY